MTEQKKSKSKKSTEFCSAVVKSGRIQHFACMKRAVAVHAKRGFCKKHAPAFETFDVFRIAHHDGSVERVQVFQPPGSISYHVVNPRDRRYSRTLWPGNWYRSIAAARKAPLKQAQEAMRDAKKRLAECQKTLQKIRSHKS